MGAIIPDVCPRQAPPGDCACRGACAAEWRGTPGAQAAAEPAIVGTGGEGGQELAYQPRIRWPCRQLRDGYHLITRLPSRQLTSTHNERNLNGKAAQQQELCRTACTKTEIYPGETEKLLPCFWGSEVLFDSNFGSTFDRHSLRHFLNLLIELTFFMHLNKW